ncbi:uncharacterized protein [Triticum aestivum]|nr:uncharacterized protein LOC123149580 isoform X2 [Triticum aestivum]
MKNAFSGFIMAIFWGVVGEEPSWETIFAFLCRSLLACILMLVQVVVLAMILGPLAIIYVLGIFMSGVISLWRLVEHDYGGNSDGETSNLAPAMNTLYYLALLQGVLFCYRFMLGRVGKRLSWVAATGEEVQAVLYNYLHETRSGCEKDPAFAKGRNLTTYAVDKISSNSPVDCISGVKILYAAISVVDSTCNPRKITGQRMLMEHLFLCASSSRCALQKLLETLGSRYDTERRHQAATIVDRIALFINLEQFPCGIQHISSLIGTFKQYNSPAGELGKDYQKLLLQGLSILQNLATDENNCRVMSDTRDLVSKIMAPVTSDLLDHTGDDHGTWYKVVSESMELMNQLTLAQGETGTKLRREISNCAGAIGTLWRIISCKRCKEWLQGRAIWILTRLYIDNIGISRSSDSELLEKENSCGGEDFVRMLVNIFTHHNEYSSFVRECAGEALSKICFLGRISDATIIIQTRDDVVDSLAQVLLHEGKKTRRQAAAAEILKYLCTHYTKDDEYLGKLKKATLKVIGKMLCPRVETHNGRDIESQCDDTQESNEPEKKEDEGFQVDALSKMSLNLLLSLLSLCGTVYDTKLIIDLSTWLDPSSFLNKLEEILVEESYSATGNLSLYKATAKMVISMLKCNGGGFLRREDFGSLIDTLSSASEDMLDLDYSMICSSASSSESRSKLNRRTLMSLVREAKELHAMVPSTSSSG